MESILFTTLTANEEVIFSGGRKKNGKESPKGSLLKSLIKLIAQLTGGAGIINIGSGNVVVIGSTVEGGSNAVVA